jgi:hypothetical protein
VDTSTIASNVPKPRPVLDVSPADWVTAGVAGFALGVRSLIPDRFEAYGRILHPVHGLISEEEHPVRMRNEPSLRWDEIAQRAGRRIHPRVQFDSLIGVPRGGARPYEAEIGTLSPQLYTPLCDHLEAHTSTPQRCWFCIWEGYGHIQGGGSVLEWPVLDGARPRIRAPEPPAFDSAVMEGPRVSIPGRDYILLEGRLQGWEHFLAEGWDSPNLVWPDDRAWCVASEIDLDSTYLGGPAELIESLLTDDRFEALRASPDDPIDTTGDTINGPVVSQD